MASKGKKKLPGNDTSEGIPFDEALRRMVNTPPMHKKNVKKRKSQKKRKA